MIKFHNLTTVFDEKVKLLMSNVVSWFVCHEFHISRVIQKVLKAGACTLKVSRLKCLRSLLDSYTPQFTVGVNAVFKPLKLSLTTWPTYSLI